MIIKFITKRTDHLVTYQQTDIAECAEYLRNLDIISIDTENSSLFPLTANRLLLQVGDREKVFVIDRTSVNIDWLNEFTDKKFIGQNIKYDYQILKIDGFPMKNVIDTMIIEQKLGMGSRRSCALDAILERRLNIKAKHDKETRKRFINGGKNYIFEDIDIEYAAEDIPYLLDIYDIQMDLVDKFNLRFALEEIEFPLIVELGDCELRGIQFDKEKWENILKRNILKKYDIELKLDKEQKDLITLSENSLLLTGGKYSRPRNFIPETIQTDMFGDNKLIKVKNVANINYSSTSQIISFFNTLSLKNTPCPTVQDTKDFNSQKDSISKSALEQWLIDNSSSPAIEYVKLLQQHSFVNERIDSFGYKHIEICQPNGRIYTTYRQCSSATGRFQSGNGKGGKGFSSRSLPPYFNSQQIPKELEYRECFIASKGYKILTIDLQGAELIILASLSGDKKLFDLQSTDIHSYLANLAFNNIFKDIRSKIEYLMDLKPDLSMYIHEVKDMLSTASVSTSYEEAEKLLHEYIYDGVAINISKTNYSHIRDRFKNVVYGLSYGAGEKKIADTLGISLHYAKIVYKTIREELHITFNYLDSISKKAVKDGYVILSERTNSRRWFKSVLDAKRFRLPLTASENSKVTTESKNAPIQGTNADIMKEAIVRISKEYIKLNNLDAHLIMQVHDEIVYEFNENIEDFAENIHKILCDTANLYLKEGITMGASYSVENTWTK